jgi:hypothetical protein
MGRIELNNPNGKYGFKVLDFTPLSVYQLRTDGFKKEVQKDMLAKMLKTLQKQFPDIYTETILEQIERK